MTRNANTFDPRICGLGEGPLWHPLTNQLFWFDIDNNLLMSRSDTRQICWQFDECVSSAGWVDDQHLLIAGETGLFKFNFITGAESARYSLESEIFGTRSNDGRADPWGGFWVGTMGKNAENHAGSIYRFYKGEIRKLFSNVTIPNSICFSHDKQFAYFTDTPTKKIMRQPLDASGWPLGQAECIIDLTSEDQNPDGAVVDSVGHIWVALWGASLVVRYNTAGKVDSKYPLNVAQPTCPAFGGEGYTRLFVTSAARELRRPSLIDGSTQQLDVSFKGRPEYKVLLD